MNNKIPQSEQDILDQFNNPRFSIEDGHITEFEVMHSNIEELPENFGNLRYLQNLNLCNNHLKTLPESIGKLTELKYLFLSRNYLSHLPDTFQNLQNVIVLHLDMNQLTTFPKSIALLISLEELSMERNGLLALPENIGNLQNLNYLHLQDNLLTTLPESIGNLADLEVLDANHNQISYLPFSIGNLRNLEALYLNKNNLSYLPQKFQHLKKLQFLNLGLNKFEDIPAYFANFSQLQSFNLYDNLISSPLEVFWKIQNLSYLNLRNNPIRTLNEMFILMLAEKLLVFSNDNLPKKGRLLSFLLEPDDLENLYTYYMKPIEELALQQNNYPGSLTTDEIERLIHEAGPMETTLLNKKKPQNTSILNRIAHRPTINPYGYLFKATDGVTIPPSDEDCIEEDPDTDKIAFRWFDTDPTKSFNPSVGFFGDPELKDHLLDPDKIVINEQVIKIEFSYPLKHSTVREYIKVGGFSRVFLAQCIFEGYASIYNEEEAAVGNPGHYKNLYNRRTSNGPYGIWGHDMGDISIIYAGYSPTEQLCWLRTES
uniref:Leucine Rich repeats (2 copies) n=1 Tax=Promethearchaeum syntrophicum TaxID=2594042 RepID=A0A5B9DF94_9ARCH|nr:leucine-rich repeat domain-containing protein [Candidatus Prometheoarchaeum syntrophicum]QEE17782.1 Leucine Rich repeats (2 copies) [Candidatus Prometheoarchaeum syntrophicum]